MSSPFPGGAPAQQSTSITSALDIAQSEVRRRVSGSHPNPGAEGEGYNNRFEDVQKIVPQQKLPALGRELFSDEEDASGMRAPPPAVLNQTRSISSNPGHLGTYGDPISRLPTPNFAEAPKPVNDADMFGLLSKFAQPFRILKAQSRLGNGTSGKADSEESRASLEGAATGPAGTPERQSTTSSLVPPPAILLRDGTLSYQINSSTQLLPPNTTSVRIVGVPEDTTGKDHIEPDEEPPRSPTLLATIHRATDRFTRRFPVSVSYRKANGREGGEDDRHLLALLGYGETGAVVEWPNAWTPEKWSLLFSVCSVFLYGLVALVLVLLTWFGAWHNSIITRITDYDILVTITSASLIVLGTSIFGICGTLLNSRPLLAIYCVLLWPSFVAMLVVGYSAYRRAAFALPNKLDQAWSQKWGDEDRMILQYSLHCCGYWSPEHEATLSPLCYPRTLLPGCKARLLRFERANLKRYYTWVFSLVPLHILNIVTAILCSNHVNRLFGKGLTPRKYRLSVADVRANALRVLETYRDAIIPPQPNRVYALRSRQLKDGTSRSPMIPQGTQEWSGRMPYEDSVGSMFGFGGNVGADKERKD